MITRTKPHIDVAQIVTNQILDALDRGVVPWRKPWKTELPKNMISGKSYRGINLLLLSLSPYASPYYLTYKQVGELGGYVIVGSKGFRIVYWRILEHVSPEGELTTIPILKYYVVFNVEQVGGIPESKLPKLAKVEMPSIGMCERIHRRYRKTPPMIVAPEAYYDRTKDIIGMPSKDLSSVLRNTGQRCGKWSSRHHIDTQPSVRFARTLSRGPPRLWKAMREACRLLGIRLLGNLVIGLMDFTPRKRTNSPAWQFAGLGGFFEGSYQGVKSIFNIPKRILENLSSPFIAIK